MPGDTFGQSFRVTNWGESHGRAIGVVVEGIPPKIEIDEQFIISDLDRRKPGQSKITTSRKEADRVEILSGIEDGKTTGAPVAMMIMNQDGRSKDYDNLKSLFRPSHADFTYQAKYGIRSVAGGGRSSARVTAGTVAAGALAKIILKQFFRSEILAYVVKVKHLKTNLDPLKVTLKEVENNIVRCPDPLIAEKMIDLISKTKKRGDSVGGVIQGVVKNIPAGLGEPVFDKIEADLAKACLSINATKGFEIGSGFAGVELFGSEHNDAFAMDKKKVTTESNFSGGVQGGITNGMPILFKVAFKPTATILQKQKTLSKDKKIVDYQAKGRHDPCVLPRAVPIVEAMTAIVLCDHFLRQRGQVGSFTNV